MQKKKEQMAENYPESQQNEPQDNSPMEGDLAESQTEEIEVSQKDDSENKIARLEEELQEQRDKYLRLVAEFDNYRKRIAREKIDLIQTANKDVIISLLDILDDCERASGQMQDSDDVKSIKEGALLIFNKLKKQLQSLGLKEMKSLHKDFDVELHDAITEIPAPSENLKGKVIDDVQKGYYLNDKLIRHAKVVVGK